MRCGIGIKRFQYTQIIRMKGGIGKQVANLKTAFSMPIEFKRAAH